MKLIIKTIGSQLDGKLLNRQDFAFANLLARELKTKNNYEKWLFACYAGTRATDFARLVYACAKRDFCGAPEDLVSYSEFGIVSSERAFSDILMRVLLRQGFLQKVDVYVLVLTKKVGAKMFGLSLENSEYIQICATDAAELMSKLEVLFQSCKDEGYLTRFDEKSWKFELGNAPLMRLQ